MRAGEPRPGGPEPDISTKMIRQIDWLKGCQILRPGHEADGAITRYPDQGWVTPYFSNSAAHAMLYDSSSHSRVEKYLNWYLRNSEKNGTIFDYQYPPDGDTLTARPDSEDAYAGTYLSLVAAYHKHTGNLAWIRENLPGLKKVAGAMINLMDRDGLTYAMDSYRVKYLMDNCEVYKGFKDFAELLGLIKDPEAGYYCGMAERVAFGIERALWHRCLKRYCSSKTGFFSSGSSWQKFYPDAACQVFPAVYGLIEPDSARAKDLYEKLNRYQPGWLKFGPPDYPWMILGYCACLHGDYGRARQKVRFADEAYLVQGSGEWFCAESAFYVITCAALLEAGVRT